MPTYSGGAFGLIVVSLLAVVGVAARYGCPAWEDSGWFTAVLFGVPLACTGLALWAERAGGARWLRRSSPPSARCPSGGR